MENDEAILESDRIDLVIQLCTRIGMIIEDVGPLALVAPPEGLRTRVREIGAAFGP